MGGHAPLCHNLFFPMTPISSHPSLLYAVKKAKRTKGNLVTAWRKKKYGSSSLCIKSMDTHFYGFIPKIDEVGI